LAKGHAAFECHSLTTAHIGDFAALLATVE